MRLPALLLSLLLLASPTSAAPGGALREVLDGSAPSAHAPFPLGPEDFEVQWVGEPLPGVSAQLEPGRLQWLRAAEVLVVPRGRLLVSARDASGGALLYAGALHPLVQRPDGDVLGAIPVVLLSGELKTVTLSLRRGAQTLTGQLVLRYRPRTGAAPRLNVDASCSPFELELRTHSLRSDSWASVGCRLVQLEGTRDRTTSLELTLLWDGAGEALEVGGAQVPAGEDPVWTLRLPPGSGTVALAAGAQQMQLGYRAPEYPRLGSLGLGVGPYYYRYSAPGVQLDVPTALLTLYGSYALSRSARLVSFAAVAPSSQPFGDLGLYLRTDSFTLFDRRVGVAVFLGGHVSAFRHGDALLARFGLPQGAELSLTDAFHRGGRLLGGALIYPGFRGRAYYNTWLRWGVGPSFVELNYIAVREPLPEGGRISLRTLGVSVGLPLASFL